MLADLAQIGHTTIANFTHNLRDAPLDDCLRATGYGFGRPRSRQAFARLVAVVPR
jgi:hypothetical protein